MGRMRPRCACRAAARSGHSAIPPRAARSCYAAPQRAAARGRAHRFRRQPASFLLCSGRSQKRSAISSLRKQPTVTDEFVLYTNPMARGRIVRRMLEETGLPCRVEVLDDASTMKAPAYLAVNPMGTVPAIRRNGAVVTECAALCAYLADAFPATGLAPDGPARAAYFRWLFFCRRSAGGSHCRPHARARGTRRQAGHGRLWDLCKGHGRTRTAVTAKPFIAGDRFSAADVYVGSHVGWGRQFGTIEKRSPPFPTIGRVSATARPTGAQPPSTTRQWRR